MGAEGAGQPIHILSWAVLAQPAPVHHFAGAILEGVFGMRAGGLQDPPFTCALEPAQSLAADAWANVLEQLKRLARWFQSRHDEPARSYDLPLVAITQTQLATCRYDKPRAQRGTAAVGAAAQAQQALQQMRDMVLNSM
jgi:hypothetical protein